MEQTIRIFGIFLTGYRNKDENQTFMQVFASIRQKANL